MKRIIVLLALFSIFIFSQRAFCSGKAKTPAIPPQVETAPAISPDPPLEKMMGAMLMFGFRGVQLSPDNDFSKLLAEGRIQNVILFERDVTSNGERNIQSPSQLKELVASLRARASQPMFVAIDQEGGQVRRLRPQKGFMDLPSAQSMGQGNVNTTMEIAERLGKELTDLGIDLDLAPVVDVDVNPYNPSIGKLGRAFGTDPQIVARHALAFGLGLARNGVVPTLKHFPGQGCAEKDTHLEMTDISQCWNPAVDLLPYAEIFQAGWPGAVMVGHLFQSGLDRDLPASLSRNIVTGLLREGLGWHGVVISDDLQMKAAMAARDIKTVVRLAIDAGVDILLFGNNLEWDPDLPKKVLDAFNELVASGAVTQDRVRQSWQRISALHAAYASKPASQPGEGGNQQATPEVTPGTQAQTGQ